MRHEQLPQSKSIHTWICEDQVARSPSPGDNRFPGKARDVSNIPIACPRFSSSVTMIRPELGGPFRGTSSATD